MATVQSLAAARAIPFLVHFTRATNLASIMQHGIVPIAKALATGIAPDVNDALRIDNQTGASCVSIAFPNHRMFYKYRMNEPGVPWAVLGLAPSILWTKRCAFCRRNAASGASTSVQIAQRMTSAAFSGLFEEIEGEPSRAAQRLKPFDPTCDQAEVLVFDTIEPALIRAVAFNDMAVRERYEGLFPGRLVKLQQRNGGYFGARSINR